MGLRRMESRWIKREFLGERWAFLGAEKGRIKVGFCAFWAGMGVRRCVFRGSGKGMGNFFLYKVRKRAYEGFFLVGEEGSGMGHVQRLAWREEPTY